MRKVWGRVEGIHLPYVPLRVLLDDFVLGRGAIAVVTVAAHGKYASQAEESRNEFHGRWSESRSGGERRCLLGKDFPRCLILCSLEPRNSSFFEPNNLWQGEERDH